MTSWTHSHPCDAQEKPKKKRAAPKRKAKAESDDEVRCAVHDPRTFTDDLAGLQEEEEEKPKKKKAAPKKRASKAKAESEDDD